MNAHLRSLAIVSRTALAAAAFVAVASTAVRADQISPSVTLAVAGHDAVAFTSGDTPARIKDAAAANLPAMDKLMGTSGTAAVQVTIDDRGNVVGSSIDSSSGQARLDRAALVAANETTYAPAVVAGTATGGTYVVLVDFSAVK